jgi:hypothetical protein
MRKLLTLTLVIATSLLIAASRNNSTALPAIEIPMANNAVTIDGNGNETDWNSAIWRSMSYNYVGTTNPSAADFTGRYKVLYDKDYIYVLAEITDDALVDSHTNPLVGYWEDDCLEIFIDEDGSGGQHRLSHNAWAYHISLDNQWVDINPNDVVQTYNTHGTMSRTKAGNVYTWECRFKVFGDTYIEGADNQPAVLSSGKKLGFMIAYNDSDATTREAMMGGTFISGTDKNRGYIDASVFDKVYLK